VEDAVWLAHYLSTHEHLASALAAYEGNRLAHYGRVSELSAVVEAAETPDDFAQSYAAFSHWMMTQPQPPLLTTTATPR